MEHLILVDENDQQTGQEEKVKGHLRDGMMHRAFSVFIFNSKGEFLLQRRSKDKMLWPLYWTNTCCSHPRSGEGYQEAGQRRLKEEMGFNCPLTLVGKFAYRARYKDVGFENELCSVLVGTYDGAVTLNPAEVAEYAWVDFEALKNDVTAHPEKYTPWFKLELDRFFADGIPEHTSAGISLAKAWRFAYDEIVYNGHLQTWGVLALVILSGQLLGIPIRPGELLIVYILFYLIYLNDRYQCVDLDTLTNARRSQHLRKIYQYVPTILTVGFVILLALLYVFSNVYAVAFAATVAVGGFLYPVYFKKYTKKIIAFKDFYVALVFSLMIVFPNFYYRIPLDKKTAAPALLLALFVFLRGIMMQFFLDLKDIDGDRMEGLRTLGVIWGREHTFALIRGLNLATCLALPVAYLLYPSLLPLSALFLALAALGDIYFFMLAAKGNPVGFILASGEFVYWPVLVYLGQMVVR